VADAAVYLTADEVWAINDRVLRAQSSATLLRDRGALESAITRPRMRAHYEGSDLVDQAAVLIIGLALAHPFVDGNKRTAAIAGDAFLRLNGFRIEAEGIKFGEALLAVVETIGDRSVAETRFGDWLRSHVVPVAP
jgi:death-on-curing protein